MKGYVVVHKVSGKVVELPAELPDFRNDVWTVESISRCPSGPSEGRVVASHGEWRQEFYPSVFNLRIVKGGAQ